MNKCYHHATYGEPFAVPSSSIFKMRLRRVPFSSCLSSSRRNDFWAMETSFISEHSVEYFVSSRISVILSREHKRVVPIYFWSSREGGVISREIHSQRKLRLLAVFPRRPKIDITQSDIVYGKINDTLIRFSDVAQSFGIPTIFCFPIISSLVDISSDFECLWLTVRSKEYSDRQFNVHKKSLKISFNAKQENGIQLLNPFAILEMASESKIYEWDEAIERIRILRKATLGDERFSIMWFWGGHQYKPIYVLIFEDK